jgi:hypothetical protein
MPTARSRGVAERRPRPQRLVLDPVGTVALGVKVPGSRIRFGPAQRFRPGRLSRRGDNGSVDVWANFGPATAGGWLWLAGLAGQGSW